MSKIKTIVAGVMTAAMVLSMTACDEEVAPAPGGNQGGNQGGPAAASTTTATTTATTTTFESDQRVIDAVKDVVAELDNPDLKVTKRLKWMAWWQADETTTEAELFKSVYGIPAEGSNANCEGLIFDYIYTSYGERYDKLANAIKSGDSPDFFPFEFIDYPNGVLKGRYEAIDDIVDLSSPKWERGRDIMKQLEINGKNYAAVYSINGFDNLLFYRKSVIEDVGLQDPRELYENDNWTWDTFLDMARAFQKSGDNRYTVMGYNPADWFLTSTGTVMVGFENGRLVNNINDPNVQRGFEFLHTMQSENLRYPIHELGWSLNPKLWAQGDILFYGDGGFWVYEETLTKFREKFGWADDEIKVVPYPKDPSADKYYYYTKLDPMMYVKGSTNPSGVSAWLDCCVTAALDPTVVAAAKVKKKENYHWSDDNLDFLYSQLAMDGTSKLTPVFEFKFGLGSDLAGDAAEAPVRSMVTNVYLTGEKSFAQSSAEVYAQIDTRINEINAMLGG